MHSDLPKVLHPLAGRPMLAHVLDTAQALEPASIITVVGHGQSHITAALPTYCSWVQQEEQLGTAHAVLQALPHIKTQRVLILFGDVPLITPESLKQFIQGTPEAALGLLSFQASDPTGFGRIIRDAQNHITGVVEERDATPEQRRITEVASGIYLARLEDLQQWLPNVAPSKITREFYLPDIVPMAVKASGVVVGTLLADSQEALGINNKHQLAIAERVLQKRYVNQLLEQGVTIIDPARLDIRGQVKAGQDVVIDVNVILAGNVILGDRTHIGANCILTDVTIGADSEVLPHSILQGATLANDVQVGPFARVRPGTILAEGVKIGNFVEIKKSTVGAHSKANHLSYIGDATIGEYVNIGAGTITCNYDGVNKFETIIGNQVFIGSNSSLVAPVKIGEGATIGAGTVLTKDAPENQLTLARAKQTSHASWRRPRGDEDNTAKEA